VVLTADRPARGEREIHRAGPEFASWHRRLTRNPSSRGLKLAQSLGQPGEFYRVAVMSLLGYMTDPEFRKFWQLLRGTASGTTWSHGWYT
jgi:hypothetical protein